MNLIISSEKIQPGDLLVNIGPVEKVITYDAAKTVEVVVTNGSCLSAAFYWYYYGTKVTVIRK